MLVELTLFLAVGIFLVSVCVNVQHYKNKIVCLLMKHYSTIREQKCNKINNRINSICIITSIQKYKKLFTFTNIPSYCSCYTDNLLHNFKEQILYRFNNKSNKHLVLYEPSVFYLKTTKDIYVLLEG